MTDFDAYRLTEYVPNHLGFGGLDRDALTRDAHHDPHEFLHGNVASALITPHWQYRGLFAGEAEQHGKPEPIFLAATEAAGLVAPHRQLIYLGKRADAAGGTLSICIRCI